MNVSNAFNCEVALASLAKRLELFQAEIGHKLNDLIHKEEGNQLWKLGLESTMHCIWAKVCSQHVGDSEGQQGCSPSQTFSSHLDGSSEENYLLFNDKEEKTRLLINNEEDHQRNSRDEQADMVITRATSSSANEIESAVAVVPDVPQQRRTNRANTRRSEHMGSLSSTHCEAMSSQNDALSKQQRRHSKSTKSSFKCQQCSHVFAAPSHLARHIDGCQKRMIKLPFECLICGRSYDTRRQLQNHGRYHRERTHSCLFCGKAFVMLSHLNMHILSHTGERPFHCGFCEKGYTKRVLLNDHVRNQHQQQSA